MFVEECWVSRSPNRLVQLTRARWNIEDLRILHRVEGLKSHRPLVTLHYKL